MRDNKKYYIKFIGIVIIVMIICAIFIIKQIQGTPMSASGMTIEEREEHDSKTILNDLKDYSSEYSYIESLKVNYQKDAVSVRLNKDKIEQNTNIIGEQIGKDLKNYIKRNRNKLTMEKEFYIYIYSKDGQILSTEL